MSFMIEPTAARYLEYLIHNFYNDLLTLKQELSQPRTFFRSDEELETIYALGYNFFTYGNYEAAKDIFADLTTYTPYNSSYWRALGAANQQLKNYTEAIAAYDRAIENDKEDVISIVYRAESQILSGNVEAGLKDLNRVLEIGANNLKFLPWVQRAELILSRHKQF